MRNKNYSNYSLEILRNDEWRSILNYDMKYGGKNFDVILSKLRESMDKNKKYRLVCRSEHKVDYKDLFDY
jgi:hypothetical protein